MGREKHEKVKNVIPFSLGYLSCLYGSCHAGDSLNNRGCKLYLNMKNGKNNETVDYLVQGFWCLKCDRSVRCYEHCLKTTNLPDMPSREISLDCNFILLQSIFFELIYDESSEVVQVSCVKNIRRILVHGTTNNLIGSEWIKCIKFLLLNHKKAVREAFCAQISSFLEDSVLSCLFSEGDNPNKSSEQKFMDIIKHALAAAEDPQIFETLLESTAQIMTAVDCKNQLFLFSLILLVDQLDNEHVTVRMNASKLIHKSCYAHSKGGSEPILLKDVHVRNELYDYLSARLSSRPKMIQEFAEAALGIETGLLVEKMIPVVLPKLVVLQQVDSLFELIKYSNNDLATEVIFWLPKVLAFALNQADGQLLLSALQYYHTLTGDGKQKIFGAAFPAILKELVCFTDGTDSYEIDRR